MFTFALFTFYFAADGPRFRRYVATLFPPRSQSMAVEVWDVTAEKAGGYVAARVVLAFINGSTSAIVFLIIGMPSWLALGIWTGVVAQFVPTIGTYIAIALPVIVGLLSPAPWIGVVALVWAVLYQQVENLTIEPRISARAVDVHPAVAFASVMLGTALFGVAGALLAIPVSAMLIALAELRQKRYELRADLDEPTDTASPTIRRRIRMTDETPAEDTNSVEGPAAVIDARTFFTTRRRSREHRVADGHARRAEVPLASHAMPPLRRIGPTRSTILRSQESSREPALIPLRYARMAESPFAFLRGAAAVMASDLSRVPPSGLDVQLCGDAHLANFGMFASAERTLMFDMNDFDETLPGSFDWDIKRLAVSMAVAAQANGLKDKDARKAARVATSSYRETMADLSVMRTMDVWNARLDVDTLLAALTKSSLRKATIKATTSPGGARPTRRCSSSPRWSTASAASDPIHRISRRSRSRSSTMSWTGSGRSTRSTCDPAGRPDLAAGQVQLRRHRPQGRRRGQRGHPRRRPAAGVRGRRAPAAPGEAGQPLRPRAVPRARASSTTRASGWSSASG